VRVINKSIDTNHKYIQNPPLHVGAGAP
jgi:hypothetical protein